MSFMEMTFLLSGTSHACNAQGTLSDVSSKAKYSPIPPTSMAPKVANRLTTFGSNSPAASRINAIDIRPHPRIFLLCIRAIHSALWLLGVTPEKSVWIA